MSWKKTVYYGKKNSILGKNPIIFKSEKNRVLYVAPERVKARTRNQIQMWTCVARPGYAHSNQQDKEFLKNCFFNQCFDKGRLKNFVLWFLKNYGQNKTVKLVEQLKNIGFEYASKAGISLGIDDLKIPYTKNELIFEAEKKTTNTIHQYVRGEITGVERFQRLIDTWHSTSEGLKQEVIDYFEATDILNPVYMMAFSGARGNISQVRQLVGMRGLMADPQGQIIDYPIRSNFREGLTVTEYLISSYGARKGIVDTALRTANAGYLTRRLVDVAQHVIISHFDCGTHRGIFLKDMKEGNKTIHSLIQRVVGRILARDLIDTTVKSKNQTNSMSGEENESKNTDLREYPIIAKRNQEITMDLAFTMVKKFDKIFVRSPLTCETNQLICQMCYGWSLGQGSTLVSIGEAVGVVAAQSIGEPGTQLTMRTFHTGGVFSGDISDQIRAPFDAMVEYPTAIPGTLIRTPEGKIAFLTKGEGSFTIKKIESDMSNVGFSSSDENTADAKSTDYVNTSRETTRKFKIPGYTLLYIRNKQSVYEKEVIAQISTISRKTNATDVAELTIPSEYEGQFYSKTLDFREKFVGDAKLIESTLAQLRNQKNPISLSNSSSIGKKNKSLDISQTNPIDISSLNNAFNVDYIDKLYEAWNWGYAWVLSGKIYELNLRGESCFPKLGDLVNSQSSMHQTQWNFQLNNGPAKIYYPLNQPQLGNKNLSYRLPKLLGPTQYQKHLKKNLSPSNVTLAQPFFFLDLLKIRFQKYGYILTSRNQSSSFLKEFFPNIEGKKYTSDKTLGNDLLFRMYEIHPRLNPILEKETNNTKLRKKQKQKGKKTLLHWFPYQAQTSTGGFMIFEKVFKNTPLNSKTYHLPYKPSKKISSKIPDNTEAHSSSFFNSDSLKRDSSFFDVSFSQKHRFTDSKNLKLFEYLDSKNQSSSIDSTTSLLRSGCTQSPLQRNIPYPSFLPSDSLNNPSQNTVSYPTESQISSNRRTKDSFFKRPHSSNLSMSVRAQARSEEKYKKLPSSIKQSYTSSLKAEFLKELQTELNWEKRKNKSVMEGSSFFKFYKFKGLIPKQNKLIPLSSDVFKSRKFGMRWKNSYELSIKSRLDFLFSSNNTNNVSTSLGTPSLPSKEKIHSEFLQKKFEEKLKNDSLNVLFNKRILWIPYQYFQIFRTEKIFWPTNSMFPRKGESRLGNLDSSPLTIYDNESKSAEYKSTISNNVKPSTKDMKVGFSNQTLPFEEKTRLSQVGFPSEIRVLEENSKNFLRQGKDIFPEISNFSPLGQSVRTQVRPVASFLTPPSSALFFSKFPLFLQTNRQGNLKPFISFINFPSLLTTFNSSNFSDLEIDFNTIKKYNKTFSFTPFKQNQESSFKQSFGFSQSWFYCAKKLNSNNLQNSEENFSVKFSSRFPEENESMVRSSGNLRKASFKEPLSSLKTNSKLNSKKNSKFSKILNNILFGPSLFHFITFSTLVSFTEKKKNQKWLSSFKKGNSFYIPSTYKSFITNKTLNSKLVDSLKQETNQRIFSSFERSDASLQCAAETRVKDARTQIHKFNLSQKYRYSHIISNSIKRQIKKLNCFEHKEQLALYLLSLNFKQTLYDIFPSQKKKMNSKTKKRNSHNSNHISTQNLNKMKNIIYQKTNINLKKGWVYLSTDPSELMSYHKTILYPGQVNDFQLNSSRPLYLECHTIKDVFDFEKQFILSTFKSHQGSFKTSTFSFQPKKRVKNPKPRYILPSHFPDTRYQKDDFMDSHFNFEVFKANVLSPNDLRAKPRISKETQVDELKFSPNSVEPEAKGTFSNLDYIQQKRKKLLSYLKQLQSFQNKSFSSNSTNTIVLLIQPIEEYNRMNTKELKTYVHESTLKEDPLHKVQKLSFKSSKKPFKISKFDKIVQSPTAKVVSSRAEANSVEDLSNFAFNKNSPSFFVRKNESQKQLKDSLRQEKIKNFFRQIKISYIVKDSRRTQLRESATGIRDSRQERSYFFPTEEKSLGFPTLKKRTKVEILFSPFLSSFFKKKFFESYQYNKQKKTSQELSKFPTSDIKIYPMSIDNNFAMETSLGNEKIQTPYYRSLNKHKRPINFSPFFLSFNRPMGIDSIFKDQQVSLSYQPFSNFDSLALPFLSSHLSSLFQIYLNLNSHLISPSLHVNNFTTTKFEDITQSLQADVIPRLIENPCFCFQNISYFKNPLLTFENLQRDFFSFSQFSSKRSKNKQNKADVRNPDGLRIFSPSKLLSRNTSSRTPKSSTLFSFCQRNEMFLGVKPVAKTNIFSPFNGEIVLLNVNKGCMVLTSSNLMSYYLAPNAYSFNKNPLFKENSNNFLLNVSTKHDGENNIVKTSEYFNPIRPNYSINNILVKFLNMTDVKLDFDLACKLNDGVIPAPDNSSLIHASSLSSVDDEQSKNSYKNQGVISTIKSKLVKVSNLVGGQPKDLNLKVRLGDFCVYGDPITNKTAIQTSGQLIHYNRQKITLRRSQPIFISPKGILHKFDNDFVDSKTPVITLSYQKLKTGDIIQGIPKVEQFFEARTTKRGRFFRDSLPYLLKSLFKRYSNKLPLDLAVRQSFYKIQQILVDGVHRVYKAQGVTISDKHLEVIVKQMTSKVRVIDGAQTGFFPGEVLDLFFVEKINSFLMKKITYEPLVLGITKASLEVDSFLSAASFQQTTRVLSKAAIFRKKDFLKGLKENVILGNLIPAGTGFLVYIDL